VNAWYVTLTSLSMVRPHIRVAWHAFKAYWRVFVASVLILFGSWLCLELSVIALQRFGVAVNVGLHVAFLFVFSGLMVGIHRMALEVFDGQRPTLAALTRILDRGPSYLLASVVYFALVGVGLLLFIAPGFYLAVRYSLFGHVIAASRASAWEALRVAASVSDGRWWQLCCLLAILLGLNIAGAAVFGLGLAISFPVSILATSSFFQTRNTAAGAPARASAVPTHQDSRP
jgi:hypothetical protein